MACPCRRWPQNVWLLLTLCAAFPQLHEAHQPVHDAVADDPAGSAVALHGHRNDTSGGHHHLHSDRWVT